MATKTFKVSLSLDNPRIIQTGIKVRSFDKQSIKIAIELTKNSQVYQIPTGAQIKISLLKLARQEQKIILDVPYTSPEAIEWLVPDYLDGYQGEVRVGIYLIVGTENIDVGYFNITSSVSDIDSAAEEFTESVLQGWAIEDLTALLPKFQAVLDETTGKDVISAPEIILARDGATTLGERLDEDKAEVTAQLAQKANQDDLDVERARIDSLAKLSEGSTTGDAELIDIRTGADGIAYKNAGNAVRGQITKLNNFKKQQVYLDSPVYIERDIANNDLYVKFTGSVLFREGIYTFTIPHSSFVSTLGADLVGVSPKGVADCIRVASTFNLVINAIKTTEEPRITIVTRADYNPYKQLLLLANVGGNIIDGYLKYYEIKQNIDNLTNKISDTDYTVPDELLFEYNKTLFDSTHKLLGGDNLNFAFITDSHGEGATFQNIKNQLQLIKKMNEYGKLDFIVHGGDVVEGRMANKNDLLKNLMEYTKILDTGKPTFILAGNHDDNSYRSTTNPLESNIITQQEWHNFVLKGFANELVFDTAKPTSKYFYKDFDRQKIRVICLDAIDYPYVSNEGVLKWAGFNGWGFGARQVHWLGTEALNLSNKDGYHILVISHIGTRAELQNESRPTPFNSEHIEGLLKAFSDGSEYVGETVGMSEWDMTVGVDFTSQGEQTVIGMLYGHVHKDFLHSPADVNWSYMSTTNSFSTSKGEFDIITINKIERKVYATRFGDGQDRSFTY